MLADHELLRRYCRDRSESAFAGLVERHAGVVYAAALRQLHGNVDAARDVTQVVFSDLARKGASLLEHRSLAGWLYTSARFAAAKWARSEQRRQVREEEAGAMNEGRTETEMALDPARLQPVIDDAMHELDSADREAVLLRFFEDQDYRSLGVALGISEEAARKRVRRAIESLRRVLQQRGISSSESALLTALGGFVTLASPADLQAGILQTVFTTALPTATSMTPSIVSMTTLKTALLFTGLLAGFGSSTLWHHLRDAQLRAEHASLKSSWAALAARAAGEPALAAPKAADDELNRLRKEHSELMRLRGEVTRLRAGQRPEPTPAESAAEREERLLSNQQVCIEAKFISIPVADLKRLSVDLVGFDIAGAGTTAILTEPQLRSLLRGLEQQSGVDMLALPRVTTLQNRAASLSVAKTGEGDAGGPALGPSLDLLPVLSADRESISLQASARFGEALETEDDPTRGPEPRRETAVSGNCVLRDGETMVLSQRLGQTDKGGSARVNPLTNLVVLVTPTLIDPAGNRLNPSP